MPNVASYLRVDIDLTGDPMGTASWTDYTEHFQSCRISRGRAGVFDLYKTGTLQLVARNGRTGIDAPWLDPAVWYRWRQIRVVYTGGDTDIPLFTGYITKTEHSLNQPLNVNIVTISAVDKLGILQEETLNFSGTADSDSFFVWLNNGLPVGTVDSFVDGYSTNFAGDTIDLYGGSTCPIFFKATEDEVPGQPANRRKRIRQRTVKGNFWQLLQDALEAEYGSFHVDAAGGFAFNGRYAALLALADSNFITLTDTPTDPADYQIKIGTAEVAPPGSDYADAAYATGTTGNQKSKVVTPSGFPETAYTRSNLPCPDDNWVQANCDLWANVFSQATTTPTWMSRATVVLNPRFNAEALLNATSALGRAFASVLHTPAGAAQMDVSGLIEGVDHNIVADPAVWEATLSMSNLARWLDSYGTWDDYGYLGSTWTLGTSRLAP